jgi:Xaa-Pro aminopeptidase
MTSIPTRIWGQSRISALAASILFGSYVAACSSGNDLESDQHRHTAAPRLTYAPHVESGDDQSEAGRADDPPEVAEIIQMHRKAVEITVRAQFAVMHMIRPGLREGDLKRTVREVFSAGGASGTCFPSIVGSGPNTTVIHHSGSSRVLREGDLVVVDIGAAYKGWCSNLTRTYPASGEFTDRQRAIYQLVLDAQRAAIAFIVPGRTSMSQVHAFTQSYLRRSPLRARDRDGQLRTMDAFFPHSVGHYLAREVHPPADYSQSIPIGQVFTIEPGIYIESEQIGVRIEDDFVLTEDGARSLGESLPADSEAIEAMIGRSRG